MTILSNTYKSEEERRQNNPKLLGGAENNYGFGDSNIVSAVQNHQSLNTTPIPLNNQDMQTKIPNNCNETREV